jgi:hypothetical protein
MQTDSSTPLGNGPRTLEQINERHREFWPEQSKLMDQRMSDETIFKLAAIDMRSETMRQVPLKSQKPFEQALADAEKTMNIVQSAFSRKGGRSQKSDALQSLIQDIVQENPKITQGQLLRELTRKQKAGDVVVSIHEEPEGKMIHFVDEDETPKKASVSGLKDRLSRAKRKIASL